MNGIAENARTAAAPVWPTPRAHVRRCKVFLAGRLLSVFAVRGSFLVIPVDRWSEDGKWHGISDVSQQAPLSTASVMVACHSKQRCLRAQLGTPDWFDNVTFQFLFRRSRETIVYHWFYMVSGYFLVRCIGVSWSFV